MKFFKGSINYACLNGVLILIGILVLIHIIKLVFPILTPALAIMNFILSPFLIAICLAYLLNPVVELFCRFKIKRSYSVWLTFLTIIGTVFYAIFSLIPYFVVNIQQVMGRIPALLERLQFLVDKWQLSDIDFYHYDFTKLFSQNSEVIKLFSSFLSRLGPWLSSFSSSFTLVLGMVFLVPVALYYILSHFHEIRGGIRQALLIHHQDRLFKMLKECESVVTAYVSGTLLVSVVLSIIASIYFSIIGLDNAIVFGTLIGFLNIIPYVGQVIGTIPAAIFGLMVSPLTPIYVILGIAALNVIEGNLVKPFVFSKSIDFHPIIVFTLIMIGGQFFGVIGMILIIPIAGILKIIGRYMWELMKEKKEKVRA